MNYPPVFVIMEIGTNKQKPLKLWLPTIILWPFLIILFTLIAPCALIAQIALQTKNIRPFSLLMAFITLLGSLRGTSVSVGTKNHSKGENFRFHII